MSKYKSDRVSFVLPKEVNPSLKEIAKLNGLTVSMYIQKLVLGDMLKNVELLSENEYLENLAKVR